MRYQAALYPRGRKCTQPVRTCRSKGSLQKPKGHQEGERRQGQVDANGQQAGVVLPDEGVHRAPDLRAKVRSTARPTLPGT